MKRSFRDTEERLHRFLGRYGNPPEIQVESEIDRAWQALQTKGVLPNGVSDHPLGSSRRFRRMAISAVFVAVVAGAIVMARLSFKRPDVRVAVESGAGTLQPNDSIPFGKPIRSGRDVTALVLPDGSRVEMRPDSELVLENAEDGVRIRLNIGSVIVTAAEQRTGHHLYVQTKDLTASVVGTVFMVNAREEGSRVAVIQGEVHVQQGATLKKLFPGDQVATGESMQALPVAAEISWSQKAPAHLALLQQNTANRAAAPARLEFAASSIKVSGPPAGPGSGDIAGFGCRGVDGKRLAAFSEEGPPTFLVPMGRCVGNRVFIPQLIAMAYGIPHRYGPNVPAWAATGTPKDVQVNDRDTFRYYNREAFQIDAVAESPGSVTTDQLRQMVQTMLSDRFKLKSHVAMEEAPGYVLSVGSTPPKLKEVSGDEQPLYVDWSNPLRRVLRGRSTVEGFVVFLMGFSNPAGYITGQLPSYILNETGLTGTYEWEFVLPAGKIGGAGGQRSGGPAPGTPNPNSARFFDNTPVDLYAWRGAAMAAAVEGQLGLRMQPQQVPVEVLVIDSVEKPLPN